MSNQRTPSETDLLKQVAQLFVHGREHGAIYDPAAQERFYAALTEIPPPKGNWEREILRRALQVCRVA